MTQNLSVAAHLLDVYVFNDCTIYSDFIAKAVKLVVAGVLPNSVTVYDLISGALRRAAEIIRRCDGVNPTREDFVASRRVIEQYIFDSANYEIENV